MILKVTIKVDCNNQYYYYILTMIILFISHDANAMFVKISKLVNKLIKTCKINKNIISY